MVGLFVHLRQSSLQVWQACLYTYCSAYWYGRTVCTSTTVQPIGMVGLSLHLQSSLQVWQDCLYTSIQAYRYGRTVCTPPVQPLCMAGLSVRRTPMLMQFTGMAGLSGHLCICSLQVWKDCLYTYYSTAYKYTRTVCTSTTVQPIGMAGLSVHPLSSLQVWQDCLHTSSTSSLQIWQSCLYTSSTACRHSWAQRKLSPLSPLNILLTINGPLLS